MKVYVNNELIDSWSKTNSPSQNIDWGNQIAQSNGTLTIGADNTSSEIFDGYMSEIFFIDGEPIHDGGGTIGRCQGKRLSRTTGTDRQPRKNTFRPRWGT